MDELVFLRETLRRHLLDCADKLEKAASAYDPEALPIDDLGAALTVGLGLGPHVRAYTEMVAHRAKEHTRR